MKKIIAFILAMVMTAMLCLALTSCSDEDEDEEKQTVKITSLNANGEEFENEVPYQPKRVAILDYAVLDMMDNFGVGDRVVSSARTTIDYLSEYTKKMDAERSSISATCRHTIWKSFNRASRISSSSAADSQKIMTSCKKSRLSFISAARPDRSSAIR